VSIRERRGWITGEGGGLSLLSREEADGVTAEGIQVLKRLTCLKG